MKKHTRRRGLNRRKGPRRQAAYSYKDLFQNVVMAFSAIGIIYGQAELLGEPWRHYVAVLGVGVLVVVAVWMKRT